MNIPRRLSTARDLVAFHAARQRLYEFFAELLRSPCASALLAGHDPRDPDAWGRSEHSAQEDLLAALSASGETELSRERERLIARGLLRLECGSGLRSDDLASLARFASLTARALAENDVAEAANLVSIQARFFDDHARDCLRELAQELEASGERLHEHAGRALAWFLRGDQRMVGGGVSS